MNANAAGSSGRPRGVVRGVRGWVEARGAMVSLIRGLNRSARTASSAGAPKMAYAHGSKALETAT